MADRRANREFEQVSSPPAVLRLEVLCWAADHNYGHRGFLSLGGEQLIFDALQEAGRLPVPPGGQLSDVLGPERTAEFLKFTLANGQRGAAGGSVGVPDPRSDSPNCGITSDIPFTRGCSMLAGEHASLIVELALATLYLLLVAGPNLDRDLVERTVVRCENGTSGG